MATRQPFAPDALTSRISEALAENWKWLLAEGLVLELLGIGALLLPVLSTLAFDILIGWLLLIAGFTRVFSLLRARHRPGFWWSLAAGVLAVIIGALLILAPLHGELTLTMLVAVLFLADGITKIFAAVDYRQHARRWGFVLFSGIADLVLVFLIWYGWPGTAAWAIGILVGVNLFLFGLAQVMLALAVRRPA